MCVCAGSGGLVYCEEGVCVGGGSGAPGVYYAGRRLGFALRHCLYVYHLNLSLPNTLYFEVLIVKGSNYRVELSTGKLLSPTF